MNEITEEQKNKWFKAVSNNNVEIFKQMFEDGFDVNTPDKYGWTALYLACYHSSFDIVRFLIDKGADVNAQDQFLRTPFLCSCVWGNMKVLKLLIDSGADIEKKDIDGRRPLNTLNRNHSKQYEELMEWLSENHPEKALEVMASDNIQSKGVGL